MAIIALIPFEADAQAFLTGHPGLAALAISGCTALALVAGLPGRLVSSSLGRLAQRLGDVSYSLYLAHWSVLVLFHYQPFAGTITHGNGLIDLLISLALIAMATAALYTLFERPGPRLFTVRRSLACAVALTALGIMLPSLQLSRIPDDQRRIFAGAKDRAPYRCGKLFRIRSPDASTCPVGEGASAVLLIGDSHADSIKTSFAKMASRGGYSTYFAVSNAPLLNAGLSETWLVAEARNRGAKAVYLHYSPGNLRPAFVIAAKQALDTAGIDMYLIAPVPTYDRSVLEILYRHVAEESPLPQFDLTAYRKRNHASLTAIREAGVTIIPVAPVLCTPICRLTDTASRPAYFDDGHLTLSGARMLEPIFQDALKRGAAPAVFTPDPPTQ